MQPRNAPARVLARTAVFALAGAVVAAACAGRGDNSGWQADGAGSGGGVGQTKDASAEIPDDTRGPGGADAPGSDGSLDGDPADLAPDPGDTTGPREELLHAGVATRSLRAPVGISTAGYGPSFGPEAVTTRFGGEFPGTKGAHTDLSARALVLRRAGKAVVLVRLDLVSAWETVLEAVAHRLRVDDGRADLADGLILSGTHTHSGPGRFIDHVIGNFAADTFSPIVWDRIVEATYTAVVAADAAAEPARVGHRTLASKALHTDRRCENGPIQDDTVGLLKVEATDGRLLAVAFNYSMHGTILDFDDYLLSSDAPGAIELGLESRLPDAAVALYLQSWAGDMAPGDGAGWDTDAGFETNPRFVRLDRIGAEAAALVIPALDDIPTTDRPELRVLTVRVPISGKLANPDGAMDAYPFGGYQCVPSDGRCGDAAEPFAALTCLIAFTEASSVSSHPLTVARIGDLFLATLPGEPTTPVGLALRDGVRKATGHDDVYVLGYSQGYLAYFAHPDDFMFGGYEAASSLFGPGIGVYLADLGARIARRVVDPEAPLGFDPVPYTWTPRPPADFVVERALEEARVVEEPVAADVVTTRWIGGDPAVDPARVRLEREDGGGWAPARLPQGAEITSDGPWIVTALRAEPGYDVQRGPIAERRFEWTARMPRRWSVPPPGGQPSGTYRFAIEGARPTPYALFTQPFVLSP